MPNIQTVDIHTFLKMAENLPMLDARSEGEYAQGHICGAVSFPILNNEERALVGTCYKQQGHDEAVLLGYKLAGPKFAGFIAKAYADFPEKKLLVHCFRGGLRSKIMAWVLHTAGFDITLLKGGYKVYRNFVLELLEEPLQLYVIGGYTGSAKTDILNELKTYGEQIIDIEALANHRGSAYGAIQLPPQPSNEQFENELADAIRKSNRNKPIWIEDESRKTGTVVLPTSIYEQKLAAPLFLIEKSKQERINYIKQTYGQYPVQDLVNSTQRLEKKLGNLRMREAVNAIINGDYDLWLDIVLAYYDSTYQFGIDKRKMEQIIPVAGPHEALAKELILRASLLASNISN